VTEIPARRLVAWLGIAEGTFYEWRKRHGKDNGHTARVPSDRWLESREKRAILDYQAQYPLQGYRRLAFMMLDVVAVSPSSGYRVLSGAGLLRRNNAKPSLKGKGFQQPLGPMSIGT
jgi:hypothetical protein